MRPIFAALALAALLPTSGLAQTVGGTYALDPDHTHVVFAYDHLGFSTSTGIVRGFTGSLMVDEADPAKSSVEASVPLSSVLTVAKGLDEHLISDDFFKGQSPDSGIAFKSTAVDAADAESAKVTGELTMNGVIKPVTFDVEVVKAGEHPMSKKPAIGLEGTATIKRSDFGLGAFAPAVSDDVQLTLHLEAQKG